MKKNLTFEQDLYEYLMEYGFMLVRVRIENVPDALRTIEDVSPDIVVLNDRLLCVVGGELLQKIHNLVPSSLILLTVKGAQSGAIITGLELGADACISDPFNPRELVARMRALLRRRAENKYGKRKKNMRRIKAGGFILDTSKRTIFRGDNEIKISGREYEILKVMMKSPNDVVGLDRMLKIFQKEGHMPSDNNIRVHISKLRVKLENDPHHPRLIRSVWGEGYVFIDEQKYNDPGWRNTEVIEPACL